MPYNVPEEKKPEFNKQTQKGLVLLAQGISDTIGRVQSLQPQTLVDAYNQPVQAPVTRDLTPLEQYVYEPQPVPEVGSLTDRPTRDGMVVPQEQPQVLSNFRNQAEAQFSSDMVSITPYEQEVSDLIGAEVDSLRNDAGEIISDPRELFARPLDANKAKVLGFVDQEGNPTETGELFFNLKESGAFNEDGTINKKGLAYLTTEEEMQDVSGEWVNKPENREIFDILWKDGLIRTSGSLGDIGAGVVDLLKKGVMSLPEGVSQGAQAAWYNSQTWPSLIGRDDRRPQELRDKMVASEYGIYEEFVRGVIGLSGMAGIAKAKTKSVLSGVLPQEIEDEADQDLVRARYDLWNAQQNYINKDAGELAETILNIDGAVKQVDEVKSRLGKDEFNKQYGQGAAFQQLFLSPENLVTAKFAVTAATSAPLATRIGLTAQRRLGNIATQEMAIAQGKVAVAEANSLLKKEAASVNVANRLASDISVRAGSNPELVARANQASQVATRLTEEANKIRATLPAITSELDNLVAKRNSLATRIPEAYSQKVLQTMELGRQMRAMPAKAVGATLERVGDTISKTDTAVTNFLQERGMDQMYTAAVGAAGVVGLAGNPIIGALGAGAAALKTGKVLSNYGKLFRYVGKEMENVRGQIPFWKRVAAHTAPGSLGRGFAHTFNMLDLGGVTSDTIRRAGRGIAAAAPTDLMFEYLSDGADMRPETLYQAGAESFFIGGSFAGAGGAFMGTKKRMRELSNGDQLNFLRDLTDTRQKALFQAIPEGTRRAISTYAIANPTLNYTFKDSGASRYDPNTNTAFINVNSTNPIKALVAHETLHHTVIKNNMEPGIAALFLGDTKNNTVGGLFRSRDGKLDPNFEAFRDAYYKRLGVDGMSNAERDAIYPLDKIAVEYFIEKHADQYAAMAESGELGAVASSGAARRKLGSILETVLPRIPVLKDLHFKSGGMIDKNGAWVTGNGILDAEGVKRDPITSKMFRDMNRRSAGLVPGQFDPLMSDKPDSGAPILLNPSDSIDAELLHPLVQVDDANKPIMKDGKPVALDRATELSRALAGLTAVEVMRRKKAENYAPEKGEAHVDDEGQFQPGWLSNDVLTEMFAKNKYNPEQKRIIREMNKLIRKGAGDRVVMINFPATTRNKAGKVVYKPQGATLRDTVPVAITISKDGNLLFGLMSVTKLHENIQKRSQDRRGKKLYGGNVDLILRDTQAMMDYHKQGLDSIEFFKQKYGAVEATERKNFINTMFGLLNKKEQAVLNPMLLEDGIKSKDNVYRTYRADRVSKAVPMAPEEYAAMPFSYEAVSQVRMPEAKRAMPEGEQKPTRFMPEDISPEDLNPVANAQEAQGRWADGKRMFAINEMDEKLIPITSKAMLESYPADAIGWMEPEAQTRFMPEGEIEPWRMTKKEFFHPQISRKFIQAESEKDGTIIGTIGDVVHGEKTRAILSPVLDVPIMIIRTPVQEGKKIVAGDKYDFDGASGTFQGKPTIFINPNKRMVGTLWEEAAHQMRRAKGRNIRKADIRKIIGDDRAFESEYKNDPEEISAKKLSNYLGSLASKEKSHREIVMNAVEAGLPVPQNVLAEYGVTENQTGKMRFMPEKLDADYMKAVESGDVEKQQRMVDEAAKMAGYGSPKVYHGTPAKSLDVFDVKKQGSHRKDKTDTGFFFTSREDLAKIYTKGTGSIISARLSLKNPYRVSVPEGYTWGVSNTPSKQSQVFYDFNNKEIQKAAKDGGHDGIIVEGSDTLYIVFSPSQIKSADPITRDNSGKVIPLSKRFDVGSRDIRYMPEANIEPAKKPTEISKGTKDALPVIQAVDEQGELKFKDGKPVPQIIPYNLLKSPKLVEYNKNNPTDKTKPNYAELAYDIPKSAQKQIDQAIDSGAVDAVVGDVVKRTKKYLENPEIAAGMGWYSRMRVKLVNALGEKGREILSQLLGATSARTPVRENFLQAMDAYEGINAGRYEPNRKAYIDMLQLEESGTLADEIVNRGYLDILRSKINDIEEKAKSLKGQDQSNLLKEAKNLKSLINQKPESWKPSQRAKIMILATDMLPKRSNGKKFNANSLAVLKVIHGSWLDNRNAPKTPNFAGNLSGRTLQATIDVWAARFLRAVLYEGKKTPWRIQPKAESAVTNEDFAIGQIIFERAAKKLKMNPDDLQAVLWFAEKDRWDKMGWTQKVGAEKSSFDDIFSIFFPDKQKPLSFEEASAKLASEGYAESAQNLDQETEDNE
jgi:hypothetical protein